MLAGEASVDRDWALQEQVKAEAAVNPRQAERTANSIADVGRRESALNDVARAVARTDPEWAVRIVASFGRQTRASTRLAVMTLVWCAWESGPGSPGNHRLLSEAERHARSFPADDDVDSLLTGRAGLLREVREVAHRLGVRLDNA